MFSIEQMQVKGLKHREQAGTKKAMGTGVSLVILQRENTASVCITGNTSREFQRDWMWHGRGKQA